MVKSGRVETALLLLGSPLVTHSHNGAAALQPALAGEGMRPQGLALTACGAALLCPDADSVFQALPMCHGLG
jgi:hypothetical protein